MIERVIAPSKLITARAVIAKARAARLAGRPRGEVMALIWSAKVYRDQAVWGRPDKS